MNALYHFVSGGIMMGCVVAGMFFIHFWNKTKDQIFFVFGFAFWIMAIERLVLTALVDYKSEEFFVVYFIRLSAFVLILFGIVNKNRMEKKKKEIR